MRSDIVDVAVKLHHRTEKAILVSDTGNEKDAVWLPLSQIEYNYREHIATMPEWLALDKGLI